MNPGEKPARFGLLFHLDSGFARAVAGFAPAVAGFAPAVAGFARTVAGFAPATDALRGIGALNVRRSRVRHESDRRTLRFMNSITTARDAHSWMRWLTARTLDAAAAIPDADFRREVPIGMGSIFATLCHLAQAERVWISALEGDSTAAVTTSDDPTDLASIREALAKVRTRWDAYLARLTSEECDRVVMRVREGREVRQRASDVLMQLPTHALYHNAQMSFMFRTMGHALPDSSWIVWGRERLIHAQM